MLASLSFAAFAGAFVTTPIVARGAAGPVPIGSPLAGPIPSPSAVAVVLPHRDPFTGDAPRAAAAAAPSNVSTPSYAPAPAGAPPAMPPLPAIPGAIVPLPPNAGAGNTPLPFAAQTARVTAVVTGAQPFALVDEAGTTRIVTVGDRIAGQPIAAITADGVRLPHGGVLTVAPASSPIRPETGGR